MISNIIKIKGNYPIDDETEIVLDEINILNNNEIVLDLSELHISCSNEDFTNLEQIYTFKFNIDFGDSIKIKISDDIVGKINTISGNINKWNEVTHTYNIKDDKIRESKIIIDCFNNYNDSYKIIIPSIIYFNNVQMLNTEFDLISSSITNNNKTSYILVDKKSDSIIAISS